MEQRPEKQAQRFRCDVCQQGFTRTDHLKRHQLRHSGIKPHCCAFCGEAFARCDSLRNHYTDCPKRDGRPVPETNQKGRRRHACELCISMKLRCDGNNPCSSCQKRGQTCTRPSKDSPGAAPAGTSTPVSVSQPQLQDASPTPTPADRTNYTLSIKFLLNGGQEGFMQDWKFPGTGKQPSIEDFQIPTTEVHPDFIGTLGHEGLHDPNLAQIPSMSLDFFNTHIQSFLQGPFDAYQPHWQTPDASTGQLWNYNTASPESGDFAAYGEPQPQYLDTIVDALLMQTATLNLSLAKQQELTADMHYLFAAHRVRNSVEMYGKIWHPNGPILHWPTFDLESATTALQAAIISMGAMYSPDRRAIAAVKNLLDIVEMLIFSCDVFSHEIDIRQAMAGKPSVGASFPENDMNDHVNFQNFQAAFMNIVVQHWSGNARARDRSMEVRFSSLIRAARAMKLHKVRHQPNDRLNQHIWIQKECRVRTMGIIHSLDCAFLFFHNYPSRLSLAEIDIDLPCDELLWCAENPFADPRFRFTRNLTLRKGFEMLFDDAVRPNETANAMKGGRKDETLGILDMFLLIHILYSFISSRIILHSPFSNALPTATRSPADPSTMAAPSPFPKLQRAETVPGTQSRNTPDSLYSNDPNTASSPYRSASNSTKPASSTAFRTSTAAKSGNAAINNSTPAEASDDPVIAASRAALLRWRDMWNVTLRESSQEAMDAAGFFKGAYKFWHVANLILSRHKDIAGSWLLEPMCEGKLERLQTLIKDGE